jgi:hypothetical protein
MVDASTDFYHWIFPQRIEIPECLRRLLERIYPTVDWNTVTFHQGLPWFVRLINWLAGITAITLPGAYQLHQIHIYFGSALDVCSCDGLDTPVHEGFHVLQYHDLLAGWGLGFLRLFVIAYISSGKAVEEPAYDQGTRFTACCKGGKRRICKCDPLPPSFSQADLHGIIADCPGLVRSESGIDFWAVFNWRWPWKILAPIVFLLAIVATLLATILIPIFELLFLIVNGLLWLVTAIVCALEAVWNWLTGALASVCTWATSLEQRCIDWQQTRLAECAAWADEGYQRCEQTKDEGYTRCDEEKDQGYNSCTQQANQGYSQCCTWWPCSWGCKALVWVDNIVCVAWTWVKNIVCVVSTWVANLICVVAVWVSNFVCVAWTYVVSWVCKVFVWVVKSLTCWA